MLAEGGVKFTAMRYAAPPHPNPLPSCPQALAVLAEGGVKFIAMRCAGYDRVDVAAADALGIKVRALTNAACVFAWQFVFLRGWVCWVGRAVPRAH